MSLLKCENVALQARAEEQAVYTEQLEYELAKTRKKHKQDLSYSEQREAQDLKQIDDLKSKLPDSVHLLLSSGRQTTPNAFDLCLEYSLFI